MRNNCDRLVSAMPPTIAIVQRSTLVADAELQPVAAAIQRQLDEHLAPSCGAGGRLVVVARDAAAPPDAWPILVVDDYPSPPSLLAAHEAHGSPRGWVAVARARGQQTAWSALLSHEVCEMVVDPWANLCVQAGPAIYSLEVCDPVEGQTYAIDGVAVSNFVLPSWFRQGAAGPWDFQHSLVAPLTMARGGYLSSSRVGDWNQTHAAESLPGRLAIHPLSRRGRRRSSQ